MLGGGGDGGRGGAFSLNQATLAARMTWALMSEDRRRIPRQKFDFVNPSPHPNHN